METEDRELKSQFNNTAREWLRLVKTICAMANTVGGTIILEHVEGDKLQFLDPARIDDQVHKYIGPRIENLMAAERDLSGDGSFSVSINVVDSPSKPHIMVQDGQYTDSEDRHHFEFHSGQVYVRHSASNSPANSDDLDRMFRSRAATLLERLGAMVLQTPTQVLNETSEGGLVVHPSDDPGAFPMQFIYPLTATSLGEKVAKPPHWVGRTAKVLGWRSNPQYMQEIPSARGNYPVQWRYSYEALALLQQSLSVDPTFDPSKGD